MLRYIDKPKEVLRRIQNQSVGTTVVDGDKTYEQLINYGCYFGASKGTLEKAKNIELDELKDIIHWISLYVDPFYDIGYSKYNRIAEGFELASGKQLARYYQEMTGNIIDKSVFLIILGAMNYKSIGMPMHPYPDDIDYYLKKQFRLIIENYLNKGKGESLDKNNQ